MRLKITSLRLHRQPSGRTRDVTVLFSDIRGFTTLSENRPPQEGAALLNCYFEKQVEVVFRHGGTLDKFIGNCIMVFWGTPPDDSSHARRAVEMQDTLLAFRQELAAEGADVGGWVRMLSLKPQTGSVSQPPANPGGALRTGRR